MDYDLGVKDCWRIAHILEKKLFSFSLLPPQSLMAVLRCREMLNKTRSCLLPKKPKTKQKPKTTNKSKFRDAVTAGSCCPELSLSLLTIFFKLFGRLCSCILMFRMCYFCSSVFGVFPSQREDIFSTFTVKCAYVHVSCSFPQMSNKLVLNKIDRIFLPIGWVPQQASVQKISVSLG